MADGKKKKAQFIAVGQKKKALVRFTGRVSEIETALDAVFEGEELNEQKFYTNLLFGYNLVTRFGDSTLYFPSPVVGNIRPNHTEVSGFENEELLYVH